MVKWSRAAHANESSGLWALGLAISPDSVETQRQIERYVALMGDGTETTFTK